MVRRAVQEVFVDLADAVLHECIRLLIGVGAPSHHGFQRTCDPISGQASRGPFGSPVFACAGKTDPPFAHHTAIIVGGVVGTHDEICRLFLLNHEKRPPGPLWELDEPIAQQRNPGSREEEQPDPPDLERVRIARLHDQEMPAIE